MSTEKLTYEEALNMLTTLESNGEISVSAFTKVLNIMTALSNEKFSQGMTEGWLLAKEQRQ